MTSSAIQMHLVGLLVPQLGQTFAKQAMGSSQLRQGARQAGRSDSAIAASSSVNRSGGRFLLRLETTPIVVELRPEHGVLLLKTGHILLQQLNVLTFNKK